jgi:hypothetical protein
LHFIQPHWIYNPRFCTRPAGSLPKHLNIRFSICIVCLMLSLGAEFFAPACTAGEGDQPHAMVDTCSETAESVEKQPCVDADPFHAPLVAATPRLNASVAVQHPMRLMTSFALKVRRHRQFTVERC